MCYQPAIVNVCFLTAVTTIRCVYHFTFMVFIHVIDTSNCNFWKKIHKFRLSIDTNFSSVIKPQIDIVYVALFEERGRLSLFSHEGVCVCVCVVVVGMGGGGGGGGGAGFESTFYWLVSWALWYFVGGNSCKHAGGHSVTTEAYISLARVCVLWRSGSSLELSALCVCQ